MHSGSLPIPSLPLSYVALMPLPRRFLKPSGHAEAAPPPLPPAVGTDVVVVLAALLCALVCVAGLALIARCTWLRHLSAGSPPTAANKGLTKSVLSSLPKLPFDPGAAAVRSADCPICLAEFADGEYVRVLPQCGHMFHVACVDLWLASHSSCPSCRQNLAVGGGTAAPRCEKCGSRSGELSPLSRPTSPLEDAPAAPAEEAGGVGARGQGGLSICLQFPV